MDYYKPSIQKFNGNELIFGYAGLISVSRGLEIFYQIIKRVSENLNLKIGYILAGRFEIEDEKEYLNKFRELNINFQYFDWTDYSNFSSYLEPVHICLDIRPPNKIYERSLPIKIFDYMALGKCIVASDYEPIRSIFEIAKCGILVNPLSIDDITTKIFELINQPELIYEYGINSRIAAEKFFNWKVCEDELKKITKELLDK